MKLKLLWLLLPMSAFRLDAQAVNWASDVAPILYDHCVSCHRAGGVGSFALETWTDAKNNADAMLEAVQSRNMPPWRANPDYRHFKDENYLTTAEIQTIEQWVNNGQLPGDLNAAPALPNFQNGSQLTQVDIALETPQFTIFQESDIYRAFAIPTDVSVDKFFNEIEFMPGNDEIIHHIVVYTDPTNEPYLLDQADPLPGWSTNGMVGGITQNAALIAEWTPGGTVIKMPSQFGYRIPANGYFIVEIHFAPNHLNQTDEGTIVNFKLTNASPLRELYYASLAEAYDAQGLINPPFLIPANTVHTLKAKSQVGSWAPAAISVFTLTPHAHIFGKSFKSYAYRQGQPDTIPLIEIPKWDFYWQSTYTLQKPLKLLTSHICRADVTYDNTENNPQQPFSPPQDVTWGEKTTNEMLFLFATVALYKPGDENIVLDSMLLVDAPEPVVQAGRFKVVNPMTDALDIRTDAPLSGMVDLYLYDLNGSIVRQWRERDLQHSRTSVADLAAGVYFLQLEQDGHQLGAIKLVRE
jgi:mono/diheme cytochrome c family protein